jgi:hypothetical protein
VLVVAVELDLVESDENCGAKELPTYFSQLDPQGRLCRYANVGGSRVYDFTKGKVLPQKLTSTT